MIFDALTYSILAFGIALTYAVVHLTVADNRLKTKHKCDQ